MSTLQKRHKWNSTIRDLKKDDLVLIVEENSPRGRWPLGRVVRVYEAKDGHVRSVEIKTGFGYLTRPITSLCFLEENISLPGWKLSSEEEINCPSNSFIWGRNVADSVKLFNGFPEPPLGLVSQIL